VSELFSQVERRDRGERIGLAVRRVVMTIFAAISLVALAGFIGQTAHTSNASGAGVTMQLEAPKTVRGGLLWQARLDIRAARAVQFPRLVLADGWFEGMQVNSIEPAAQSESGRDGRVVLSYCSLQPGDRLRIWLQFQVDPTARGRRSLAVELDNRTTPVARIDRDIRVLP
jgi:hypothetical protein